MVFNRYWSIPIFVASSSSHQPWWTPGQVSQPGRVGSPQAPGPEQVALRVEVVATAAWGRNLDLKKAVDFDIPCTLIYILINILIYLDDSWCILKANQKRVFWRRCYWIINNNTMIFMSLFYAFFPWAELRPFAVLQPHLPSRGDKSRCVYVDCHSAAKLLASRFCQCHK